MWQMFRKRCKTVSHFTNTFRNIKTGGLHWRRDMNVNKYTDNLKVRIPSVLNRHITEY